MKYSVVTFGCRVNQADSLAIEAELCARGGEAVSARSRRPRHRQHLLGDGERRPGRASDHPSHRARESRRAHRRDRLLCHAVRRTRSRRCPASRASCRTTTRHRRFSFAARSSTGHVARRRSVRPAARAGSDGPHGVDAARADRLRGAVQLLHHPDDARRESQPDAARTSCAEVDRVVAAGYKEIVITGVHLGSYGRDLHAAIVARSPC